MNTKRKNIMLKSLTKKGYGGKDTPPLTLKLTHPLSAIPRAITQRGVAASLKLKILSRLLLLFPGIKKSIPVYKYTLKQTVFVATITGIGHNRACNNGIMNGISNRESFQLNR